MLALLGLGNLAHSLLPALLEADLSVQQLISRDETQLRAYQAQYDIPHIATNPAALHPSIELLLLCVPDAAIASVAKQLPPLAPGTLVVHTSGATPRAALDGLGCQTGVLYPLQMFTQDARVDFGELPLFVEGNEAPAETRLLQLARKLSRRVYRMDSPARARLHLGAVLACNFSNYLFHLARRYAPEQDFTVYQPLLEEQLRKVFAFGPQRTQTGPAIRGDQPTLARHFALLGKDPKVQALYEQLSRLIIEEENWESP